tara:strand:+ start:765 stop:1019 length:255 start_codon:yes stop_codon:yes gene_type:complete
MWNTSRELKQLVKSLGIKSNGRKLTVRSKVRKGEFIECSIHTKALSQDQIAALKNADSYIKITNIPNYLRLKDGSFFGFAIIKR